MATRLALDGYRRERLLLWGRYTGGSVVAAVVSEAAFLASYGLGASPLVASVVAFVSGAVPNYVLNRYWAWRRRGRADRRREMLPYVTVIVVTALAAIGATTLADSWVHAHVDSHAWRTILVGGAYLGTYGVMFVVKFVVFDRLIFAGRAPGTPGSTSRA